MKRILTSHLAIGVLGYVVITSALATFQFVQETRKCNQATAAIVEYLSHYQTTRGGVTIP